MSPTSPTPTTTLDPAEVEKFSRLAAEWWNPTGKMSVLHKFNPVRLAYIREAANIATAAGVKIARLNVGGGLPNHRLQAVVPQIEDTFQLIDRVATEAFGADRPALICEPGRCPPGSQISPVDSTPVARGIVVIRSHPQVAAGPCATTAREPSQGRKAAALSGV